MDFTFGIITAKDPDTFSQVDERILTIIRSIQMQKIPRYQIIIVGDTKLSQKDDPFILCVPFVESQKTNWITRKKNLVTANALYENIVFMHDYIGLEEGWYQGFLRFFDEQMQKNGRETDGFKVCMTKLVDKNNKRFLDWIVMEKTGILGHEGIIPYHITHLSKIMYMPGFYWIAKKSVMKEFPLNEALGWGDGEDIEWSERVTQKYPFSINTYSTAKLLKEKHSYYRECSEANTKMLENLRI